MAGLSVESVVDPSEPHHGGGVLGKAERSIGHGVMLIAGLRIPNTYRPR